MKQKLLLFATTTCEFSLTYFNPLPVWYMRTQKVPMDQDQWRIRLRSRETKIQGTAHAGPRRPPAAAANYNNSDISASFPTERFLNGRSTI